jgi:FMN phosphatase YigB (HAD superfamily)
MEMKKMEKAMQKAILFDLDGTLLLSDEEEFYGAYFKALSKFCSDLMEPMKLVEKIQKIMRLITMEDGKLTNYERFMNRLEKEVGNELAKKLAERFNTFYSTDFDNLKRLTLPNEALIRWMRTLSAKKVLATNPIFPRIAIVKRMRWAGLKEDEFDLITVMEDFHYLKPRSEYYLEIAKKIEVAPEECLMIGNDTVLDGACTKAGMKFKHVEEMKKELQEA